MSTAAPETETETETETVKPTYKVATLEEAEAYQIDLAMSAAGGNMRAAATSLGIDTRRLKRLLQKHGLY